MKIITVHRVSLQFDADQITHGKNEQQVRRAVDLINLTLQREPFGLGAQLIATQTKSKLSPAGSIPLLRHQSAQSRQRWRFILPLLTQTSTINQERIT